MVLIRPCLSNHPQFAPQLPCASILACETNTNGRITEGVTFPSGAGQGALAKAVIPAPCLGTLHPSFSACENVNIQPLDVSETLELT